MMEQSTNYEHEIIIWLAALISTDGSVRNSSRSKGLSFVVFSSEKDWLDVILRNISSVGVRAVIKKTTKKGSLAKKEKYYLWIHHPRKLAFLFEKHNAGIYFNPRKWRIVEAGIKYYHSAKNRSRFTGHEDDIIKRNFHLSNKSISELLEDRSANSVYYRKRHLMGYDKHGGGWLHESIRRNMIRQNFRWSN